MNNLVALDETYPIERSRLMDVFDFSKYTPDEMLLLDVYLSKINPQDSSTKRIQFRKKEYELFLEKKRQQAKLFKDTAVGLYYKPFDPTYLPDDIGFNPKNIWKECSFEKDADTKEWVFTMECSDDALPFFFDTQKYGFIRYLVGYTKHFTYKYSFILYYFLKRKRQEERKYGNPINPTIAELKRLTGTSRQKTYKEFKYFKRDVIEKAIEEINCFTDIDVAFDTVRKGRAVERVLFTVTEKRTPPLLGRASSEPSVELKDLFAEELEEMEAGQRESENGCEEPEERDETDERLLRFIPEECQTKLSLIRKMLVDYAKTGDKIHFTIADRDKTLCDILDAFNAHYEAAKAEGVINKSAGGWYVAVLAAQIQKDMFRGLISEPEPGKDGGFDMGRYMKMFE